MNSIRSYFRESKHEIRRCELLSTSAFIRAGKVSGCERFKEFFRGQMLFIQAKEMALELHRIWKNRHR
jgi:ribosomal protein L10